MPDRTTAVALFSIIAAIGLGLLALTGAVSATLAAPVAAVLCLLGGYLFGRMAGAPTQSGETHMPANQAAPGLDALVVEEIGEGVLTLDDQGRIRRANDAAAQLLGQSAPALKGLALTDLIEKGADPVLDGAGYPISSGRTVLKRAGSDPVPVAFSCVAPEPGRPEATAVILRSLANEDRSKKRIRYLARYDSLTRVANRMEFQHRLQQAIARARRNGTRLALLYVDIDRFKDVNDRFGHLVGDRSLEIMARRIVDFLEDSDLVGRLAGDEFAVLIEGLPADSQARAGLAGTSRMLLDRIANEFHVERQEIFLTASIGVACFPDDGDNVIDLIRNADAAMYHAKKAGGNTYGFYAADMNADAVDRLMLKSELRRAMERDEFLVLYQPKVDLRDGRIAGAEALLRWSHPKRGDVPPGKFIPLAEEGSLIFEIGEWVLNRVCSDYLGWQTRLAWPGRVAVNLSLKQLRQRDFVQRIEATFEKHRLTPSCVELEITESTLMDDGEKTLHMLDRLYELGLHLSIDDFGTGYSSLSALQHFPIGTLKIDQSFVQDAGENSESRTIVTTIINMGRSLNMDVVAEGVETREQLEILRRHGCTYGQGHLFGAALTATEYRDLLLRQQRGERPDEGLFA
jgi:diguanylate cyclase (GGDEF)-like protein